MRVMLRSSSFPSLIDSLYLQMLFGKIPFTSPPNSTPDLTYNDLILVTFAIPNWDLLVSGCNGYSALPMKIEWNQISDQISGLFAESAILMTSHLILSDRNHFCSSIFLPLLLIIFNKNYVAPVLIKSLDSPNATCPDKIPPVVLKNLIPELCPILANLFIRCLK